MPSQKLRRLTDGNYALVDDELLLICTPATSCGNVELVGSAFLTRSSGWRLLRRGLVDIGFSPIPELAIERLLDDRRRQAEEQALSVAVNRALPL